MALPCVVHLDLKGAPWKLCFLRTVIPFIKRTGACGILLEWEDTFPYTAALKDIGSLGPCNCDGVYNEYEVKEIIQIIKDNGMEPIQLVQSIGHMEFVLKHKQFEQLRERWRSPAVLCPTKPDSLNLVKIMVQQVLEAQPDASYIHIGADEAWYMNECDDCQRKSKMIGNGAMALYLDHIKALATFIKTNYPNVKILMWDDMMRSMPLNVLRAFEIGQLVQPVVWNYNVKEHFNMDSQMWERYSLVFDNVWAGSAFKGANGSCQIACSSQRYASNQLAWHNEIEKYKGKITFSGVILTGWSRFDHYATLCELLPVALPSLVSCLRMWNQPDGFTNVALVTESLPFEQWPAHLLALSVNTTYQLRGRILAYLDGDQVTTYLSRWNIDQNYTSPLQMESIATTLEQSRGELYKVRIELEMLLGDITGRRSADEFVQTYVLSLENRVMALASCARARASLPASLAPGHEHQQKALNT